ncbi:MAG TPA: Ig domain-containing protein, partial [Candidatus Tectomicrobia bacterium]
GSPQWLALSTAGTPPPQRGEVAPGVYDPLSNRLIVFGGLTTHNALLGDVWVLSNANGLGGTPTWTPLAPGGPPPTPRGAQSVVYDANSNRLLVFGGMVAVGSPALFTQDVWALTHANGLGGPPEWVTVATSALTVLSDKAAFFAATGATSATGPLPNLGLIPRNVRVTVGTVTFSTPSREMFIGDTRGPGLDWSLLLPGNDIAISESENLDVEFSSPTFAFGFDFHEPSNTSQAPFACSSSFPCVDSTFQVTLFDGAISVGSFSFNAPDDIAAFVGVQRDIAFNRVEIREISGSLDDEYFGQFYTGGPSLSEGPLARGFHSVGYAGATNRMVVALGRNDRETPTVFNDAWVLSNASGHCTAGQPCNYQVTATDPDAGDVLTYSLTTAPTGMTIQASTGLLAWTPTPAQIGDHSVTVRVVDSGGLSALQRFTVTVAPVAVPHVVGLDPASAEALIGAADLRVGAITHTDGAITLQFDTLPSAQGWRYIAVGNSVSEPGVFSVNGGTLLQNAMGVGFAGQGSNIYTLPDMPASRLPYSIAVRARVLAEEGDVQRNSFGFVFGANAMTEFFNIGIGLTRLTDTFGVVIPTAIDHTQWHDYRLDIVPTVGYTFFIDGLFVASGLPRPLTPAIIADIVRHGFSGNELDLGDGTGGTNARAEVTHYRFIQPRVISQAPPLACLSPISQPST